MLPTGFRCPQFFAHARRVRARVEADAGFSLVEVMIAGLLMASLMGFAALAVTGSSNVSNRESVRSQQVSIARRVLERAQGDLQMQTFCAAIWRSDTPPTYRVCNLPPHTIADRQGRRYTSVVSILPVDDPADGDGRSLPGGNSADGDGDYDIDGVMRDYYNVTINVTPVDTANLGGAGPRPYEINGRVDWDPREMGSIDIYTCSHYRRDRSVSTQSCAASQAIAGVRVSLVPTSEPDNTAVPPGTLPASNGSGRIRVQGMLQPGTYRVQVASPQAGHEFFRAEPSVITISGGETQELSVFMVRIPGTARVCGNISNDADFGYEVDSTNFAWSELHSPVWKGRMLGAMDRDTSSWQCWPIFDPINYDGARMFRAEYGIQAQQQGADFRVLSARSVARGNCSGGGGAAIPNPSPDKPVPTHVPTDLGGPWKGVYTQTGGDRDVCLEFWSRPFEVEECAGPGPGCSPVCVANCTPPAGGAPPPPGSVGPPTPVTASSYGGPNDRDPGGMCYMDLSGSGWFYGTGSSGNVPPSSFINRLKVGGTSGSGGVYANGERADCAMHTIATTFSWIPMNQCVQIEWNGNMIRAKRRDYGAVGRIDLQVGAARSLDPGNPSLNNNWNAFYWGVRSVTVRKVSGDPVCNYGGDAAPPPEIKYFRVVDNPAIGNPGFAGDGNEGSGRRVG